MNILVTGSSGYIAANLIPVFSLGGHNVVSYDITEGRDILDLGTLATYMEYCDAVIHLAAIVGIVPCRDNLIETINVNIRGTLNVVTLAQQNNIPLIFASTFAAIIIAWAARGEAPYRTYRRICSLARALVGCVATVRREM